MEYKLNLSNTENKDLTSYCNLNDLRISEVIKKSYLDGFNIERYGLLNMGGIREKQVEKEVIVEKRVEIPVEVIKEVVKIEYVEVEKPVEIIKEVVKIEYVEVEKTVEKIVEKEVIKEIIKEVPVEKLVEKEVIREVIKEVPVDRVVEKVVEVIKEIPVEKVVIKDVIKEVPVEKIVYVTDQEEMKAKIFQKEKEFEEQRQIFSTKTQELENNFHNEKNELLLKIRQLENQEPKTIEVIKEIPVEKVVIQEKIVEVVKEIPIEKVVVQEKIVEVVKEIPVEVIKEVIIEKQTTGDLQPKLDALQNTVHKLKQDNIEKDKKIREYEQTIQDIQKFQDEKKAMFLKGSNLDDKLYK